MFLINQAMVDVPIGTAALIVVLGMAVVFFGLILLMLVTKASGKIMQNKEAAAKAAARHAAARLPRRAVPYAFLQLVSVETILQRFPAPVKCHLKNSAA